ncbi:MAG: OsmC family protein [Acidobacteria bacterium]|nr:OsmC family protein [Acidobacteriota bacterium]
MSEHRVSLSWNRGGQDFNYETYPRDHTWRFPGGSEVRASAAPGYQGNSQLVDPEEAFVAALSSCHMLTFLAIASRRKVVVDAYADEAVGYLEKEADGHMSVTRVYLRPRVAFAKGTSLAPAEVAALHARAHEHCFLANSVRTKITVEPRE